MGKLPSNNRTYNLQHLQDSNREMLRMLAMGMRVKDVAEAMNVTTATVENTKYSEIGQELLGDLRDGRDENAQDVGERIKALAERAMDRLEEYLEDDNAPKNIQFKTATDVLDRAGWKPPERSMNFNVNTHYTPEELAELKRRRDQALKAGQIVSSSEDEVEDAVPEPSSQ